jgi:hypothetical protein
MASFALSFHALSQILVMREALFLEETGKRASLI